MVSRGKDDEEAHKKLDGQNRSDCLPNPTTAFGRFSAGSVLGGAQETRELAGVCGEVGRRTTAVQAHYGPSGAKVKDHGGSCRQFGRKRSKARRGVQEGGNRRRGLRDD